MRVWKPGLIGCGHLVFREPRLAINSMVPSEAHKGDAPQCRRYICKATTPFVALAVLLLVWTMVSEGISKNVLGMPFERAQQTATSLRKYQGPQIIFFLTPKPRA